MAFNLSLGKINVIIGAKTEGFRRGMKDVSAGLKKTGKRLRSSANTYGKWGAGIASAAALAGAAMFKMNAATIDSLAKTADKLGITTEALAGLRFAAEQTGLSTKAMDKALLQMTRNISEAATGTGLAVDAFEALGLSAEDLITKSPDEALEAIADAMLTVENQTDKVGIAFDLFGAKGTGLLNTMAQGSEGLKAYKEEASKLGIAISRVDAKKVEDANDQLNIVSKLFQGIGQQATVSLAPIITAMAESFTDAASNAEGFGDTIDDVIDGAVSAVGIFADGIHGMGIIFKVLELVGRGVIGFLVKGFEFVINVIAELSNGIVEGIIRPFRDLINLGKQIPGMTDAFGAMGDQLDGISKSLTIKVPEGIKNFADAQIEAIRITKKELSDMAMEEIPSVAMKAFVEEARLTAEKAAAEAVANIQSSAKKTIDPNARIVSSPEDKVDPFIQKLIESGKTETELENLRFSNKLARLNTFTDSELEILGGFNEAKKTLEEEHTKTLKDLQSQDRDSFIQGLLEDGANDLELENMRFQEKLDRLKTFNEEELEVLGGHAAAKAQIEKDHAEEVKKIKEDEERVKLAITMSAIDAASQALMSGGKKAQAIGRRLAIVNALIKGGEAAVAAWSAGMATGGPWAPAVAAAYTAASLVKTAGLINSIRSGGKASSGGGRMPNPGSIQRSAAGSGGSDLGVTGTNTSQDSTKIFNINLSGETILSSTFFRRVIEGINEETDNGLQLNVIGG